jgi:hypothetical protein
MAGVPEARVDGIAIAGLDWAGGEQSNDTGVMMEHELSDDDDKSTEEN